MILNMPALPSESAQQPERQPGCGRPILIGDVRTAIYTRASTEGRYHGLKVLCRECFQLPTAMGADYVIGTALEPLACGEWVLKDVGNFLTRTAAPP